jgi:hypothetical protein
MKERPILFSGPMVRAIIEGRKTQTRRILKPAFEKTAPVVNLKEHGCNDPKEYSGDYNDPYSWGYPGAEDGADMSIGGWLGLNPYGMPSEKDQFGVYGSRLWVRETFLEQHKRGFFYKATDENPLPQLYHWRPSIHMPRRASRITLEITDVRVERVQDISHADILAEGINSDDVYEAVDKRQPKNKNYCIGESYRWAYKDLWDSLNAKRGFGWNVNPWVWVICFKRVEAKA